MGKGKAGGGRHAPDAAGLTRRTAASKAGGADKDATEAVVEAKPLWSSGRWKAVLYVWCRRRVVHRASVYVGGGYPLEQGRGSFLGAFAVHRGHRMYSVPCES